MTKPVPTPRFSCLCGEPYMVASLDPANDNRAIQRHACPCERPVLPIFEPDAWRPGPLLVVVVGFLLAVAFVVAVVVDVVGRVA